MSAVRATVEQVFEGVEVGEGGAIHCDGSEQILREGDNVVAVMYQAEGSDAWTLTGVYHPPVAPSTAAAAVEENRSLRDSRIGLTVAVVYGRLAVASDQATQKARLVLCDVDQMDCAEIDTGGD